MLEHDLKEMVEKMRFYENYSFTGSDWKWEYPCAPPLYYREGVKFVMDEFDCWWVLRMVCGFLQEKGFSGLFYTVYFFKCEGKFFMYVDDGNYNPVYAKELPSIDLSVNLKFYLQNLGYRFFLYLPSEY